MSDKRAGRSYSKKQRSWRRSEDPPRDGATPGLKQPTAILSKPKAEESPDFPSLLQANASSNKKSGSPAPVPMHQATGPPTTSLPWEAPKQQQPKKAPVENKKKDPLEALEFPPVPESRLRLVDAKVGFHESGGLQDYLSDSNTDFLVVGVIGSKGTGKSSILNGLIGSSVFRENDLQSEVRVEDCTQGIDAWINSERVIFLDAQPTLNGSFLRDRLRSSHQGKYFSLVNCYLNKERLGEKENLLLSLFLMNICHCLLFVQDYVLDPEVLHFLQLAEMLKPPSPTLGPENNKVDYYPNLILVHNKLRKGEMTPGFYRSLSEFYNSVFAQSAFHVYGDISASQHPTFRDATSSPETDNEEEDAYAEFSMPPDLLKKKRDRGEDASPPGINLMPLSDKSQENKVYEDLLGHFARVLLSSKPRPLTTKTLTEKSWYSFAAQAWQNTCMAIMSFNYEFNIAGNAASSEEAVTSTPA